MSENFDHADIDLAIDEVLSNFEANWGTRTPISIEDCLAQHKKLPSELLLQVLIPSELELLEREYRVVNPQEYVQRFPAHKDLVLELLEKSELVSPSLHQANQASSNSLNHGSTDIAHYSHAETFPETAGEPSPNPDGTIHYRQIGRYRPLAKLGHGGMGIVFEAWDERLNRRVALKLIQFERADSTNALTRFRTEARAIASIQHPSVVTVYDHDFEGDYWYIAMELIHGQNLKELMDKERPNQDRLLSIVALVADGLNASHQRQVVHRDIKPMNILVRPNDQPVIIDFGLARLLDESQLSRSGELLGTPAYMSPEQVTGQEKIGPAVDIHALGIILYEIATNGLPFHGKSREACLAKIRREVPLSPRVKDPSISRDLDTIIMKCLEKEPQNRYHTAADVAEDLRRYLANKPIHARPIAWPVRLTRWTRREPQAAGIVALLVFSFISILFAAVQSMRTAAAEGALAQAADERRLTAEQASDAERKLREAAQAASLAAEDAARLAESQQVRAICQAAQFAIDAGKLLVAQNELSELHFRNSRFSSLDTRWLENLAHIDMTPKSHFSASDRGLYDYGISSDEEKLASVDRSGRIDVWEIETGKLEASVLSGATHPTTNRSMPRWTFETGDNNGHAPLKFPVSITWESPSSLLAAFLDGRVIQYSLLGEPPVEKLRHEEALHFIRKTPQGTVMLVDAEGTVRIYDLDWQIRYEWHSESAIDMVRFVPELSGWVFVQRNGLVWLVNQELEVLAKHHCESRAYDCRIQVVEDTLRMLVASREGPVEEFLVTRNDKTLVLQAKQNYQIPARPTRLELRQACQFGNRIVALDDQGGAHVWEDGKYLLAADIGLRMELRVPTPDRWHLISPLEDRNSICLESTQSGWLQISRTGTVKLFSSTEPQLLNPWRELATKVGPFPQVEGHPSLTSCFWTLSRTGALAVIDCNEDRVLAQVSDAHVGGRAGLAVLANGDAVTVGNDRLIKFWRMNNGSLSELRRVEAPENLVSLAVNETRNLIAALDVTSTLHLFDLNTGRKLHSHLFNNGQVAEGVGTIGTANVQINSGRVAFSKSGQFVGAFGAGQCFEVIDTELWERQQLADLRVTGPGGTALCFSPIKEGGLLHSSATGLGVNAIGSFNHPELRRLSLAPLGPDCIDLKPTVDKRRIVGLSISDEICFIAGEHLHQTYRMKSPIRDGNAIAVGSCGTSLLVAGKDGQLAYGKAIHQLQPVQRHQAAGVVHWPSGDLTGPSVLLGDRSVISDIADRAGHTLVPLLSGSAGDSAPDRRLALLRKRDGIWKYLPLRFEGDEKGPCWAAHFALSPQGRLVTVIRQGLLENGTYNGRVLLAHEPEHDGVWPTELVLATGNMGYSAQIFFSADGQVAEISHFDFNLQTYARSQPPRTPGEWDLQFLKYAAGAKTSLSTDSDGVSRLLLTPLHGQGSDAPSLYAVRRNDLQGNWEFEKHWNSPGNQILMTTDDRVLAWDHLTQRLSERTGVGEWKTFVDVPSQIGGLGQPRIDSENRIWFCECHARRIDCYWFDLKEWRLLTLNLEQELPEGACASCRINGDGKLEVLVYKVGEDWAFAVVESVARLDSVLKD